MKETSPIHLDLFEVIKSAIASGEEGGEISELEAEVPEEESKVIEMEKKETTANATLSKIQGIISQAVAVFLSLTQKQKLLFGFVVLYFVTKVLFRRRYADPTSETLDNLNKKVDDLTSEVLEMKSMLEKVLEVSNERTHLGDEL